MSGNILNYCVLKKRNNYRKNSEDTVIKIIATHNCKINETFIGIFMSLPIGYILYYHHDHN